MKNSLTYLQLWQKKRSELPVDENPQGDWVQMQSLLDTHLPIVKPVIKVKPPHTGGGFLKVISYLVVSTAAAATIFHVVHTRSLKQHHHPVKHKTTLRYIADSASKMTDTLALQPDSDANNDLTTKADSLSAAGSPVKTGLSKLGAVNMKAERLKADDTKSTLPGTGSNENTPAIAGKTSTNGLNTVNKANKFITHSPGNKLSNTAVRDKNSSGHNTFDSNNLKGGGAFRHARYGNGYQSNYGAQTGRLLNAVNYGKPQPGLVIEASSEQKESFNTERVLASHYSFGTGIKLNSIINFRESGKATGINGAGSSKINVKRVKTTGSSKRVKSANSSSTVGTSPVDWGLLAGVNTAGSFTPKSKNSNIYGRLPVDAFFGLFVNYPIKNNWAVSMQIRLLSAQNVSGNYTHISSSTIDSGKALRIIDSRKLYSVQVPIQAVYKASNMLSFKAGPVISIPVKQIGGSTSILPDSISKDSAYYSKLKSSLNKTNYLKSINVGISAGVSVQVKRLIFEASYLKSLSGTKISSDLGSYKTNNGTFQFTIGFQLNKPKH